MLGEDCRRLVDKLIREIGRSEAQTLEHLVREAARIGPVPPIDALQAVADHAVAMHRRFVVILEAHDLEPLHPRGAITSTLASLRHLVVDRVVDPERAFRTALLELRHGMEIVELLRDLARREMVFGLIRWSDDWLAARRTLVACAEAQLTWYIEREAIMNDLARVEDLETDHRDHF